MSVDDYLRMSREGYQYLVAQNFGACIEYPFYSSALHLKFSWDDDDDDEEEEEDETLPLLENGDDKNPD